MILGPLALVIVAYFAVKILLRVAVAVLAAIFVPAVTVTIWLGVYYGYW